MVAFAGIVETVFWGACIVAAVVLPLAGYVKLNIGRRA